MNSKKHHHSVFFSWVVSYFFILLIPIVISGFVYLKSVALFKNEIMDTNQVMLTQLQQAFDGQIQDVQRLALQIGMNPKLNQLYDARNTNELFSSYSSVSNVLAMNADFNLYATVNGNIQSFYIVFTNKDMVWANSTLYSKRDFFHSLISDSQITYEQWLKIMEREYVGSYIPLRIFRMNGQPGAAIAFIQSIPFWGSEHQANLVILMNENKLNQAIQNINRLQKGSVWIIDRENHVLFDNYGRKQALPGLRYDQMKQNVGLINCREKGKNVVISYITSQEADWKYVFVIPTYLFEEKVLALKRFTLFGLVFCLIVGGGLVFWRVKQNYNPLHEVLRLLGNIKLIPNNDEDNEFKVIQNSIYQVYHENEAINRRLMQQNETLRSHFLLRLLQGRLESEALPTEITANYGINLVSDRFSVLLFYIEDSHFGNPGVTEGEAERQLQQAQQALGGLVQEQLQAMGQIFPVEYNEMLACIVNVGPGLDTDWEAGLQKLAAETQKEIEARLALSCSIAASGLHETLVGIGQAYQEAMDALEYRLFEAQGRSLYFFNQLKQLSEKNYNYIYTTELEQKLINSIKVGDLQQAMEQVNAVLGSVVSGKVDIKLAKFMMFDIVNTIVKVLNSEGLLMECQFFVEKNVLKPLLECKNANEAKQEIELILQDACRLMDTRKKAVGKNEHLVAKINELLQTRYPDVNLSLTQLAEDLQMNPKYLSAVYKEATGISIVDLLARIRVGKAKELLQQTECSIADIAVQVGYCNSNALIRAFKRVEGITPGQFKELG